MISLAIVLTGLVTVLPDLLMLTFDVELSYQIANIFFVTLFYVNSICNPCIYFCTRSIEQEDMAAQKRKTRKVSQIVMDDISQRISSSRPQLDRVDEV